jgi:channel protein (hemolysin III family)
MIFLGIYVVSCVLLFYMSGVNHNMAQGTARDVLGRLDHNAIFLFIAGSFTPAHGILFRGWLRWAPLLFIWTAAIVGVTLKTTFFNDLPQWAGLLLYLALGWLGALSGILLYRLFGYRFVRPLLWGGIAYSIGGAIDGYGWPILIPGVVGPHEVFHFAVLLGALLHWRFNWQFASNPLLTLPCAAPPAVTAMTKSSQSPPHVHGFRGVLYMALGCFFVGLGALGAVLPVLPTTPFLLLASFFFVRSSPRLYQWLLRSPLFGPFLRDWHEHRGVRPRVKVIAVSVMLAAVGASIFWGNLSWPFLVLLLVLAAVGLGVVLRLPVIRDAPLATLAVADGRDQPMHGDLDDEICPKPN